MLKEVTLYFFSPTGGTQKVGELFAAEIAEKVMPVNLGERNNLPESKTTDTVILASPVFGGRIPALVADKIRRLDGNGKKAVTLVVYGNRAYEDALLELNNAAASAGFHIAASGAFIAQHSMIPDVAKGRPDEQDKSDIRSFARKVVEKLKSDTASQVTVPGNHPYKDSMRTPAQPVTLPSCSLCGKCSSVCPTAAISIQADIVTTHSNCILCMACVSVCPKQARILPPPLQDKMNELLGALKNIRRENEYFL